MVLTTAARHCSSVSAMLAWSSVPKDSAFLLAPCCLSCCCCCCCCLIDCCCSPSPSTSRCPPPPPSSSCCLPSSLLPSCPSLRCADTRAAFFFGPWGLSRSGMHAEPVIIGAAVACASLRCCCCCCCCCCPGWWRGRLDCALPCDRWLCRLDEEAADCPRGLVTYVSKR